MNDKHNQAALGFSVEDQELLSYLLAEEGLDSQQPQFISRRVAGDKAPLSFGQQRLWFLDQLQPSLPVYNITSAVRLQGKLNVAALERTLSEIVRRHDALRTTFALDETQPVQIVHEPQDVHFAFFDLTHLPPAQREDEARRLATEEARRPFNLATGPLLRPSLLRLSDDEHIAVLAVHHIVSDGWSMNVMLNELTTLYDAFSTGERSRLPELPVTYADYAAWQRQSLNEDFLAPRLAYWREHLAGMTKILELPADRPRPPVQTFRGAKQGVSLPASLVDELRSLSLRHGVTLFMTTLAAFLTLLSRYTQQTDLAVGTPTAGRNRFELEGLIGFFINTLVLRADVSGDPPFLELLAQVKTVVLDAHAQEVPFEKLIETLQPERNLSHQALFQVMFALQTASTKSLELHGLRVNDYVIESGNSRFDLTLSLGETAETLTGVLEYSTDLFDTATVARLAQNFETLLHSIVANPQERISRLRLLTRDEERQLLCDWNTFHSEDICGTSLSQIFEAQVERAPEAIALSFADEQLTYDDLNRRANQLAHYLRKQGVGSGSLVGLCMERSLELVIALLGIVKAGAAYVPLDPAYPKERLAFMMTDAQVGVVVTQCSLLETLPAETAAVVCVDEDWKEIERESDDNLTGVAAAESLAYVIYTSGSTGIPKGVAVTQANVLRLFSATRKWYGFDERDVWTLFHSYAFDFSVWELFGALLHGGRLVIVPYLTSRTPENFYQLLLKQEVTVLNQTPSAFDQLMRAEEINPGQQLALQFVIFGGEALEPANLRQWYERHDEHRPQLVNMYGITETTVHVTHRPLRAADAQAGASMIGRPIPDLQVYVLDAHAELLPVGVPGELYVGGDGLAAGYLNRPDLTADRFVPHPFSTTPGARLYRSGDRARYRPDGDVEYLGRIDDQVKVRGFRIELGEIEAILGQHHAIKEVVVTAREDVPGDRRLVAYFVAENSEVPATSLRNYLKERLPEYMIPSAFVSLPQLPLTANGKVDRRALPAAGSARPELSRAYTEPSNEIEEALAAIWANALGLERVGIHDNFFELGGDSILSVRVLAKAKEIGLEFSLQQLFQYQTIAALAEQLNRSESEPAPVQDEGPFSLISETDRAKLPADLEDAYPLAMLQAGMLYHMAYSPGEMIYHNVYSHHVRARLDIDAFRLAVRKAVERHPILRTSFDLTTYTEPLQLVHRNVTFPVDVDDLRPVAPEEQERIIDEFIEREKWRRFDYAQPPLLRFHIHRRTEDSFNFTLTECHPILDGWSLHSLLAEIFTSYFASLDGKSNSDSAPRLASTYREFVRRERQALSSQECASYWQEKLRGITPTDLPRWPVVPLRADVPRILKLNYPLSEETSKQLKKLARSLGVPLKSVLLAAHLKVLSIVCGRNDVVTGLVSSGRLEETDGDKTIGLFFNTLPFHAALASGSWKDLIQSIFKSELELLPFRRYPVAALQRQWGQKPLFESVFNYLHFHVLDELAQSGALEILSPTKYWEETNLTLSTAFVLPPLSDQINLTLRFDTTQFSETQINSISGYYLRVLDAMVADADQHHDQQTFLDHDELQRVLVEWSGTSSDRVGPECIHQVFDVQAEKTPEAIALVHEDEQLTYRELNERANRIAGELRKRGVGPDVPVVIYLERSLDTVVFMLAVLKAGGAYVPIEPGQPPQRIALMIEEVAAPLVLTKRRLIDDLPVHKVAVWCSDDCDGEAQANAPDLSTGVSPANLAYLIFTSGSTGRPKAVAVEHRQLLNYARGISQQLALPDDANYALASTFTTDLGHTAIFPPLLSGGTLHVLSTERLANPSALADYFEQHCIDCLKIVPSHLAALLGTLPARGILPRSRLVLGGDVCRRELVEQVQRLAPDCEVFNHYGPTETTVGALTYRVERHQPETLEGGSFPLGRPLPGARIYILDASLNPVPIATPGEICISGEGVARGYLNQPSLTAESFVADPFSNAPGARIYRTGDIGRYLPDGNVEFLGRRDHQIKIRGYRVELGEIEVALSRHPAVRQAVVVVDREHSQEGRFVAYVVTNSEPPPSQAELRRHLREQLPEYAVPADFVLLDELPLTAAGKVDRKSLPSPDNIARTVDRAYTPPRNAMEQTIAEVWRDFLHLERMSIHDNFFDLGGHSLVLLQIRSKLGEVLQREISIVTLFEHPTISSLAEHLSSTTSEKSTFLKLREDAAARKESLARRRQITYAF